MTAISPDAIGPLMHQVVPLVATLGLEYQQVSVDKTVVVFRDRAEWRNHVGGPHAAAMFAVAESATGAVAIAAFADMLDRALLLPITATMDFLSIAKGDLTATAYLEADADAARTQFDEGTRPEFDIVADITNAEGTVTGRLRARWTLKAIRRD